MWRLAALPVLGLGALASCTAPPGREVYPGGAGGITASSTYRLPPAATVPPRAVPPGPPGAEAEAELALARGILTDLQRRSFEENREFCGYIGLSSWGELVSTPAVPGDEATCPLPAVPPGMTVLASFHTHGTYSPYYASEWPTAQDVMTDAQSGINGYISTPGGRLWHVDTQQLTVRDVCGRGCLPQDPNYVAAEDGPLRPLMTLGDLQAWEGSMGDRF